MTHTKKHVLIVGGGFGGVKAALDLAESGNFEITLISNRTHFQYNPSLFHTATGGLTVQSDIPLETIFAHKPVKIVQGEAQEVHRKTKSVKTADGHTYHYDILILALGMITNYFGIKGLAEYSLGIKTVQEAKEFKQHIHQQLINDGGPDLNYVVVGGGPTGIELAGALPEYLREVMRAHNIKHRAAHVHLVEAAPHLVPRMPKRMSRKIEKRLRSLGIKLHLGKMVQGETADALTIDGKELPSKTVVWTAGQANAPFYKENNFTLTDRGKVLVDEHLQAEPDIYVLGDNNNTLYSGMAQTALYDARFVASNLIREATGKKPKAYKPKKPVYVLPAGPYWAAVLWGKLQLYGTIGWLLRTLADLVGFHDVQPWWNAGQQWLTEFGSEEACPVCIAAQNDLP